MKKLVLAAAAAALTVGISAGSASAAVVAPQPFKTVLCRELAARHHHATPGKACTTPAVTRLISVWSSK